MSLYWIDKLEINSEIEKSTLAGMQLVLLLLVLVLYLRFPVFIPTLSSICASYGVSHSIGRSIGRFIQVFSATMFNSLPKVRPSVRLPSIVRQSVNSTELESNLCKHLPFRFKMQCLLPKRIVPKGSRYSVRIEYSYSQE